MRGEGRGNGILNFKGTICPFGGKIKKGWRWQDCVKMRNAGAKEEEGERKGLERE